MSDVQTAEQPGTAAVKRQRLLSPADNPLVRAVGRVPATVNTKLMVAFLATAVLVVVVGLLGVLVLGQANDRVERIGALQSRAFAYGQLQRDAFTIRLLLAENVAGDYNYVNNPDLPPQSSREVMAVDQAIRSAAARIAPATAADIIGFAPPAEDEDFLQQIRLKSTQLEAVMQDIVASDASGPLVTEQSELRNQAELLAIDLNQLATELTNATTAKSEALMAENVSAYASSRNLFIGGAAVAIVLALLLGFVLSRSLIGPMQRIDSRLAAIASGDFSGHVDVSNRDELGALAANVNQMNDELRRLYRELETTNRHKSEFLANMSHELRTPLNAILGFTQVLRGQLFGPVNEKQAEYLEDILSSGQHLLALINDVLDLSKVEAGQLELEITQFSLRGALESGVLMVRERATQGGVEVRLAADPQDDIVEGDERRIRQVIFNLLSNAVKFTPPGGGVDVTAVRADGEVRVSVADTGPGIAPEDHERIFGEFQQGEAGLARHEGTGLGLALSRRLVELHGGRIWVNSEPDVGSTFVFTLPARRV